ncbi:MAG: AMP-binding protein [Firmicutes bacterium]|nr:AMP-binding protein [Bacillota bacterium]
MRENLKKTARKDLLVLSLSDKTFKALYNVMFSHENHAAYEFLDGNYEIQRVLYRDLRLKINAFARLLQEKSAGTGEFIGIDLDNSPAFIIALWGILQSGNKPYLVNSYYPTALKNKLLARLNVKIIVTDNSTDGNKYENFDVIIPDVSCESADEIQGEWGDEIALSSSMTGLTAKICVYDGAAVSNQILNSTKILKNNNWLMDSYDGHIKIAAILPFFHIFGIVVGYFWFAFFGRTIVFLRDRSPETVRAVIKRHGVTHIFAPPILYHRLYKGIMNNVTRQTQKRQKKFGRGLKTAYFLQNIAPRLGVRLSKRLFKEVIGAAFGDSVRFMITGGAFIDGDALKVINCIGYPLFNGYGTTETAITSVDFRKKIKHRSSGSVGVPFDSVKYTVGDDKTLSVSGTSVCKKIILPDREETGFDRIYTDDIVEVQRGQFYVKGRKNDLFIGENGENISPDTVESGLKIKSASEFSVLEIGGRLCLVLEYGQLLPPVVIQNEVERLKRQLLETPNGASVNEIYITRDKISSENAVKVSRALLKKRVSDGEVKLTPARDLSSSEQTSDNQRDNSLTTVVKALFQKALDTTDEIDENANFFFDLGGTSLDYFMLISELSSVFNVQINLEKQNQPFTVSDVCKYLTEVL